LGSIEGTTSGTTLADVNAALMADAFDGEMPTGEQVEVVVLSSMGVAITLAATARADRRYLYIMESVWSGQ